MTVLHAPMPVAASRPMMGGTVSILVHDDAAVTAAATEGVLNRIEAWAGRLTRFDPQSELMRLNDARSSRVPIGPTLTAVLDWARTAEGMTDGIVDVALLDARLAAEAGADPARPMVPAGRRWSLARGPRGSVVRREPGVRFDLDGVAKGWLADRTLDLVLGWAPGCTALVDGDGDIAAQVAPGDELFVGVADPATDEGTAAVIRLAPDDGRPRRFGVATSGTSVHRWTHGAESAHHLIDPVTWRPADTDVAQATVLADTARAAEAFAKAAVLAGSDLAGEILDRPGVHGGLLITTRGEIRATPGMLAWLA